MAAPPIPPDRDPTTGAEKAADAPRADAPAGVPALFTFNPAALQQFLGLVNFYNRPEWGGAGEEKK